LFFAAFKAAITALSNARPRAAFAKMAATAAKLARNSPSVRVCGKLFRTLRVVSIGSSVNLSARRRRSSPALRIVS
jgi:hypothetical protein